MKMECEDCGRVAVLEDDPDYPGYVLLRALDGWSFQSSKGWRCGECQAKETK